MKKDYRFKRVEGDPWKLRFKCCRCGMDTVEAWADLNGKPYRDYYCNQCKERAEATS